MRTAPGPSMAASIAVAPMALLLIGCAEHPRDGMLPVAATTGSGSVVDILVATTRRPAADPARLYSGERGTAIAFDRIQVSIPPDRDRKIGEIQWPSRVAPDPAREFAVLRTEKFRSEREMQQWLRQNRTPKRREIIFVHGFNTTYSEAVFRFAQIVHDGDGGAAPVLFTWPSRGDVFDYLYDKESANYSRHALEELILQSAASPDVEDVTIVAHSMGCWLTVEALRSVGMRKNGVPSKIRNVVLAAPDLDVDVFRRQWVEMGPKRPHFTIVASKNDKALGVSRLISGGIERVGGADLMPYRAMLSKLGISVVDASAVDVADPLGHTGFAESPEIVRALGRRISMGQTFTGDAVSTGEALEAVTVQPVAIAGSVVRAVVTPSQAIAEAAALGRRTGKRTGPLPAIVEGRIAY